MLKTTMREINYKGKKYNIVFNLNVLEEIQNKYGSLDNWGAILEPTDPKTGAALIPDIKEVINSFEIMINEGIEIMNDDNGTNEPLLNHKQVGRIVSEVGVENIFAAMQGVAIDSTKEPNEKNA